MDKLVYIGIAHKPAAKVMVLKVGTGFKLVKEIGP